MIHNIHSIDPEFEKLTIDMTLAFIEKIDALFTSLGSFFYKWWYRKQNTSMVEMTPRTELRIIDSVSNQIESTSDVDLDDLVYVQISLDSN